MGNVGFVDFAPGAPEEFKRNFTSTYKWYKWHARCAELFMQFGLSASLGFQVAHQGLQWEDSPFAKYLTLPGWCVLLLAGALKSLFIILRNVQAQAVNEMLMYTHYFTVLPQREMNFRPRMLPPEEAAEAPVLPPGVDQEAAGVDQERPIVPRAIDEEQRFVVEPQIDAEELRYRALLFRYKARGIV